MADDKRLRDKVAEEVGKGFSQTSSVLISNTKEILSDGIKDLYDDVKGITMGSYNVIKGSFKTLFGKKKKTEETEELEKHTGIFKKFLTYFKDKKFADAREKKPKKKSMLMTTLLAIMFGIGAGIGAILGSILLPFKAIIIGIKSFSSTTFKFLSSFPKVNQVFASIKNFFISIKNTLGKFFGKSNNKVIMKVKDVFKGIFNFFKNIKSVFGNVIGKTGGMLKNIGNIFKGLFNTLGKIPFIGNIVKSFIKGFMFGFKKLFFPLTIILSLFDFVKGFMKTEGSIVDKIKGGLKNVVLKFIELPVKAVGWIGDWILGLFGVKVDGGVGAKLMGWIDVGLQKIMNILYWPMEKFIEMLGLIMNWEEIKTTISGWWTSIKESISGWWTSITKWVSDIWSKFDIGAIFNSIAVWIAEKYLGVINFFANFKDNIIKIKDYFIGKITSFIDSIKKFVSNLVPTWSGIKSFFGGGDKKEEKKSVHTFKIKKNQQKKINNEEEIRKNSTKELKFNWGKQNNNNNINQSSITQQTNEIKQSEQNNNIPDEIENMGLLFNNKSYGW